MSHKTNRVTFENYESESSSSTDSKDSVVTQPHIEPKNEPHATSKKAENLSTSQSNVALFQTIQQNENASDIQQSVKTTCDCCDWFSLP